ncbi:MAG: adenylyltransferase/cytidyltransferase family protein [archaeon]
MSVILVIGRFQPFHKGHFFLLERLSNGGRNRLEIAIGSSNARAGGENPFSWRERKRMIERVLRRKKLARFRTFPVPDTGRDADWLAAVLERARPFDIVVSGNTWVLSTFSRAGFAAEGHKFLKKRLYSGTEIRRRIRAGRGQWKHLVEREVSEIIEKDSRG